MKKLIIMALLFVGCTVPDPVVPKKPYIIIDRVFRYQNDCGRVFSYKALTDNNIVITWWDTEDYMIGDTIK